MPKIQLVTNIGDVVALCTLCDKALGEAAATYLVVYATRESTPPFRICPDCLAIIRGVEIK